MVDEEKIKIYVEYINNAPKLTEEEMKVYKKVYFKSYYKTHADKIKERARNNYVLNREKKKEQNRLRYKRLKEEKEKEKETQ